MSVLGQVLFTFSSLQKHIPIEIVPGMKPSRDQDLFAFPTCICLRRPHAGLTEWTSKDNCIVVPKEAEIASKKLEREFTVLFFWGGGDYRILIQ